mmetsp:Transcript_12783/g.32309  ORF Transcript_12783/g.32309 Transcript_12783/m.32309 type:complete len:221 (+) Transcript_12783:2-664(+)
MPVQIHVLQLLEQNARAPHRSVHLHAGVGAPGEGEARDDARDEVLEGGACAGGAVQALRVQPGHNLQRHIQRQFGPVGAAGSIGEPGRGSGGMCPGARGGLGLQALQDGLLHDCVRLKVPRPGGPLHLQRRLAGPQPVAAQLAEDVQAGVQVGDGGLQQHGVHCVGQLRALALAAGLPAEWHGKGLVGAMHHLGLAHFGELAEITLRPCSVAPVCWSSLP